MKLERLFGERNVDGGFGFFGSSLLSVLGTLGDATSRISANSGMHRI